MGQQNPQYSIKFTIVFSEKFFGIFYLHGDTIKGDEVESSLLSKHQELVKNTKGGKA